MNHCQKKCLGWEGNHGGCCTVHDRNFIIGPIHDSNEFLARLKDKFQGIEIKWDDIFINYEEGHKMHPEKATWQDPKNYPCLRLNKASHLLPCIFYNSALKCCSIYEIRPTTCRNFTCDYLRKIGREA